MTKSARTGPLQDLTIIDCSMAYAGPFGTSLLANMGANVIKVEPPQGDNFRPVPPFRRITVMPPATLIPVPTTVCRSPALTATSAGYAWI